MTPLLPLDKIEFETGPTKVFAFISVCPIFFAAVTGLAIAWNTSHIYQVAVFFVSIFLALVGCVQIVALNSTHYYITKQQIIIRRGFFSRSTHYLELYRIKDISVSEPFLLGMMGMMNVELITFDTNEPDLVMRGIPVSSIPQTIRERVQECRQQNKILTVDR
jgi:uncharacterized membrane protein YdbT with pleckstrin-like domain